MAKTWYMEVGLWSSHVISPSWMGLTMGMNEPLRPYENGGLPISVRKREPVPPPRPKSRRNRLPETRHPQSHGLDDLHITIKQPNIKPSNIVQLHQIKDGFQMFSIHQGIHLNWFILPKTRFFSHNPSTCSIFHLFVKEKRNFLWFPQQFPRNSFLGAKGPAKTPPTRTLGHQALEGGYVQHSASNVWQIMYDKPWIYMEYLGDVYSCFLLFFYFQKSESHK